jgi:hypothetical protein
LLKRFPLASIVNWAALFALGVNEVMVSSAVPGRTTYWPLTVEPWACR